jgi:hypothetical protein
VMHSPVGAGNRIDRDGSEISIKVGVSPEHRRLSKLAAS